MSGFQNFNKLDLLVLQEINQECLDKCITTKYGIDELVSIIHLTLTVDGTEDSVISKDGGCYRGSSTSAGGNGAESLNGGSIGGNTSNRSTQLEISRDARSSIDERFQLFISMECRGTMNERSKLRISIGGGGSKNGGKRKSARTNQMSRDSGYRIDLKSHSSTGFHRSRSGSHTIDGFN